MALLSQVMQGAGKVVASPCRIVRCQTKAAQKQGCGEQFLTAATFTLLVGTTVVLTTWPKNTILQQIRLRLLKLT